MEGEQAVIQVRPQKIVYIAEAEAEGRARREEIDSPQVEAHADVK